ncbi:MAG: pyridoxamine 5'-phosphate oxidase family protein [Arenicellales bacterium]
MFTDRGSLKWRNIQRNPHASLCVDWRVATLQVSYP